MSASLLSTRLCMSSSASILDSPPPRVVRQRMSVEVPGSSPPALRYFGRVVLRRPCSVRSAVGRHADNGVVCSWKVATEALAESWLELCASRASLAMSCVALGVGAPKTHWSKKMRPTPFVAASCAKSLCVDISACSLFPSMANLDFAPRETGDSKRKLPFLHVSLWICVHSLRR
eukprot:253632-Pleurochrysis_carterae.AAC.1